MFGFSKMNPGPRPTALPSALPGLSPRSRTAASLHRVGALAAALLLILSFAASRAQAQTAPAMTVGTPTVDANGVRSYPVSSVYQGSQQQIIRVLEPTHPTAGLPRRILYVLPVDAGVDTTASQWSDGLEELRLLDVQDRFNLTLIAPSFNYEPWYGDNVTNAEYRMESFILDDLVPFGDTFAQGSVPQRYLIGFSKSGNGVLFLLLRHPGVFNAGAAWDSPAQLSDLSSFSALTTNFGTQANYDSYNIPSLVSSHAQPFLQQNRLWISGDQAAWTADMIQLNDEMNAAGIPHTWVQGPVRAHSWNSGWLDGAITDLAANARLTAPYAGTLPPPRTGGWPAGTLVEGTTQTTLSLKTDDAATCRYSTSAGVAFGSMTQAFTSTGGTTHSTLVAGLANGGTYTYYVRCQDTASGLADADDYVIGFSIGGVAAGNSVSSNFSGVESPLSENGMWSTTGSWTALKKNNGAYTTDFTSAARLAAPTTGADQFAEITYDQDPGSAAWPAVMTRIQPTTGSCYLAIAYDGQVRLYRTDDTGALNFTLLASANASIGTAPRRLRLESLGATHQVYFNGALLISYTDPNNLYANGQPGIAAALFGGPTVKILSFTGGSLSAGGGVTDTTPPVRSAGQPSGTLPEGTTQTNLTLTTDEPATCRYSATGGVAYSAMTSTFATTGGTAHSTPVSGLQDGGSYTWNVRCQDSSGNANPDDYAITFSVAALAGGGTGQTATSTFAGVESPLSENGTWSQTGSWAALSKSNGAYTVSMTGGARLVAPAVGADQFAEITYDQDPGSAAWPGVMTRAQSVSNGSGYLAIAYAGQVRLYRTDDQGGLQFTLLASANATIGTAPRRLRLESQGSTHRVYFNGALLITWIDPNNVYPTGQPGIAAAIFGGPTVKILSFTGGALTTGSPDTTPPVRSGGAPTGTLASGTTQTTLSLTTNEAATCRYAATAGVAFASMTGAFTTTGGTAHSTLVTGLQSGASYSYSVRCQDTAGNVNTDDYAIAFSVAAASGGGTASSSFTGVESPLSENGMWATTGSWAALSKNNGAYTANFTSAARLVSPVSGADQFAEITYDQDPGSAAWPGVMTRVQGAGNGGNYLAIAYAGQVRLYRTDDNGSLNFVLLASANAAVGTAPRRLRLESQGSTHRVYFNGALLITWTDPSNVYPTGQPGIAAAIFGGPTVKILSFTGGALTTP